MQQLNFILPDWLSREWATSTLRTPYYVHAAQHLDEGGRHTAQLHLLCHWLNWTGCPAWLVDAPRLQGRWWTPRLTAEVMASHYAAGCTPISIHMAENHASMGLPLCFTPAPFLASPTAEPSDAPLQAKLHCLAAQAGLTANMPLALPWLDMAVLYVSQSSERTAALVYSGHLPMAAHCTVLAEHAALQDVSPFAEHPVSIVERWRLLANARVLYAYAGGTVVDEARLLGCDVVYVSNDHQLRQSPQCAVDYASANELREALQSMRRQLPDLLKHMVQTTQQAALEWGVQHPQRVWSAGQRHAMQALLPASLESRAECADAAFVERLCDDYIRWQDKASPQEIDSDLCAEVVASGRIVAPVVHLFAHGRSSEALADSMDALGQSWLPVARLVIHADVPPPPEWAELDEEAACHIEWIGPSQRWSGEAWADAWVVAMEAGTRVVPWALIDLLTVAHEASAARVVYAAHDVVLDDEGSVLPQFSGGANVEWLRGHNYLGGVLAVRTQDWMLLSQGWPEWGRWASMYRLALHSMAQHGSSSVQYVDKVLSRSPRQLARGQEVEEFTAAQAELQRRHPSASLVPGDKLGCWRVRYPDSRAPLTLLVPTGKQTGYLRSLLLSCMQHCAAQLLEVLLLVDAADVPAVQDFVQQWPHADVLPLRMVVDTEGSGSYNHARRLNLGMQAAHTELVLVCDDDVSWLDSQSVTELRRLFAESDVAVAAPRLVLQQGKQPLVVAGPHVAGEQGLLNYTGLSQQLLERGNQNRLQMAQDVAGFHGACWMARRAAVLSMGGLNAAETPLFQAVADLGYRLQQGRWRLVWTPHASALHFGGMTLQAARRDPHQALALTHSAMHEASYMRRQWSGFAGGHPLYSRHFSGKQPYTLDTDVVCTWGSHKTRPRALALPLRSGSGQYRIVEPLDALQLHSLAQTCVVEPETPGKNTRRVVTALDVARLRPDRLLVQHSISDADIANLRAIRTALPDTFIVQLMDDLTSELPPEHPNYQGNLREGHTRTLEALRLSDRLIVSTQPLADYYAAHCKDIRIVPNALDMRHWGGWCKPQTAAGPRLRIGWVGAGQHQGDLRCMQQVVQALAGEVDWVFMGMCPDELRPFIKEFHPFVSYSHYPKTMAGLALDIAIAPLQDNPFNACKSNLRLLEYGAMGWPVVCSDVYPYRTDDPPVARVANTDVAWLAALRALMADTALRQQRGRALHEWMLAHYTLEQQVPHWYAAIFE